MSRTVYMSIFLAIAVTVIGGAHHYLWARLVRDPGLPAPWRQLVTALIATLGVGIFALPLAVRGLGLSAPTWLNVVAFTWLGSLFLLMAFLGGADLLRLLRAGLARWSDAVPAFDPDRRQALARMAAAGASFGAVALTGRGVHAASRDPQVYQIDVPIAGLPAEVEGLRIAQISDLHISSTIRRAYVERVVALVNREEPDLVAITGDLMDGSVAMLREDAAPLAALRSRHGTFFCTGNHEYYSGVEEWMTELQRLGIRPLRNARVTLGEGRGAIELAGVDDYQAGRFGNGLGPDLSKALQGRDVKRPLVLLAHQPKAIHEAAAAGVDLVLSGHTHGGQIWPFGYLVALTQPYLAGLHRHQGGSWIYVSRGTGYWGPPMRLGAPHEITVLRLVRG